MLPRRMRSTTVEHQYPLQGSGNVEASGDGPFPSPELTQLLLSEFDARLARYRQLAGQQSQLQHWALVFSGALWAWVLSRPYASTLAFASWIPVLVNILLYGKVLVLGRVAGRIYRRLDEIISVIGRGHPAATRWQREGWSPWAELFWGIVILSSVGFGLMVTFSPEWIWAGASSPP